MPKSFAFLLTGVWALLACLGSGCRKTAPPHGSTEVGLVYDYIVRRDSLVHGSFVALVPAGFHRYRGVSDTAALRGRTARLRAYLDSTLRPLVRPECLATPNTSAEWQALRAQLHASGNEPNAIFLAFSARCDGPDGRHYYYVERSSVTAGRRSGSYEGDVYVVYQGQIEREILVWIS